MTVELQGIYNKYNSTLVFLVLTLVFCPWHLSKILGPILKTPGYFVYVISDAISLFESHCQNMIISNFRDQ